jgi:hypothetical protein
MMQEDKDNNASESNEEGAKGVPSDATNKETLSEIRESEKVSSEKSESDAATVPSPDGAFDSLPNERGPKDDPGPM